jgi:hydroxymethylglutaryl-CoA lyase
MFGKTVVFADTVGVGTRKEVELWSEMALLEGMTPALHLHHKGDEEKALQLIRVGLLNGVREFDSSIGGLGGCPFVDNSGANLSTETLVLHLNVWGFETGVTLDALKKASKIARQIKLNETAREIKAQ